MHLSRRVCLRLKPWKLQHIICSTRLTSTQSAEVATELKFDEEILNFQTRVEKRKPAIEPFAKNLFLSIFNTDILAFPEILDKDDMTALDSRVQSIKNLMADANQSDDDIRTVLKNNRIYGANAVVFLGGLASNCTEKLRILEEIAKYRVGIAREINNHWMGISALKAGIGENDLDRLMPDFSCGRLGVRICMRERLAEEVDVADLRTIAKCRGHGKWTICGEKVIEPGSFVEKGGEYILVVCSVNNGIMQTFLVEPNAPGVSYRDSTITFSDTPATMFGIDVMQTLVKLGPERTESKPPVLPIQAALVEERLHTSAICIGLLKEAITTAVKNVKGKFVSGKPLSDLPLLRNKMANAVTALYVAESMAFLTAGLQDGYENPDVELEAIITRMYATREASKSIHELLETLKPLGLEGNLEQYAAHARTLLVSEGQNDSLAVYGALLGLQHAGMVMAENIKKMRNPMFHPLYIMQRIVTDWRQRSGKVNLTLHLDHYLHPSLAAAAMLLERAVLSMRNATETALLRHGNEISNQHRDLDRLIEMIMQLYGMTASIARASRSYCIGMRGGEREMYQSVLVVDQASRKVQICANQLEDGYHLCGDNVLEDLARDTVRDSAPPMEHCLTRVFF